MSEIIDETTKQLTPGGTSISMDFASGGMNGSRHGGYSIGDGLRPSLIPPVDLSMYGVLAPPFLDAIRQIVREEVRPAVSAPDDFAQKILSLINAAYGEMEHMRDDRALYRLQDAVEEIKTMCEQRVQKEQTS
jgi:hypothetical protein